MEKEVRFYFSTDSEEKLYEKLNNIDELKYDDKYYEKTMQYNHPMNEYDFYSKNIDGRFRVRISKSETKSKSMITWKKRIDNSNSLIHNEEEVEVSINEKDYDKLIYLIENVLHLKLVESYERYRRVFYNNEVEIVIDKYPFGLALEIECKNNDSEDVLLKYIDKLGLDINNAYKLSWDDKYLELCKMQDKTIYNMVSFDKDMPSIDDEYN